MPNFHPMLVHFPIALLTIYALLELLRIRRLREWEAFFFIKATLVLLGALSAVPVAVSGLLILQEFAVTSQATAVLTRHWLFASAAITIFLVLAIAYALAWRSRTNPGAWTSGARRFVENRWSAFLALIGLIFITITGALGGGFVHGSQVDPMVSLVFKLLGL